MPNDFNDLINEEKNIKQQGEIAKLKGQLSEVKSSVKYWQNRAEENENRTNIALAIKDIQKTVTIKPTKGLSKSETVAISVGADWHAEEKVDPETIDGLNETNLEIIDQRIKVFFKKSLKLVSIWRTDTIINNFVLAFLGDLMNGYIHEEFLESNYLSPTETILWLQDRICSGIDFLLNNGKFNKIIVPCVYGNHGRTTPRKRISTGYKNSYEWLMYQNLARFYQNESKVEFVISKGDLLYVDIFGFPIRFRHGDQTRYNGGIGGISVPVNRAVKDWNDAKYAYLGIFGHWHRYLDGRIWVSCPSLVGYNQYARDVVKAPFQPPAQVLIFIEKTLGKTGIHQIYL